MFEEEEEPNDGERLAEDLGPNADEPEPGSIEAEPSFDVTSGEDLVDRLPSGDEVPDEVEQRFWKTVLLLKVTLLSLTLAVLLAYFRGRYLIAGGLGALGLLAAGRTAMEIRAFYRS